MTRVPIIVLAMCILGVVAGLVWGSTRGDAGRSVDELPSVAEVVAAQAHRHGIALPALTDEDRVRLSAAPTLASDASPYQQVRQQLVAVRDAAGVNEAIAILGEVARQNDTIAADCPRLYADIVGASEDAPPLAQTCPA